MCRSCDTYMRLCVEKYELVRAFGIVLAARSMAARIAALLVASPVVWKTTTFGGRTPTSNAVSVRWLASYAGLPGIEKLWYQRLDNLPAATPPIRVSTTQTPITTHRRRLTTCARLARIPVSVFMVIPLRGDFRFP